MANISEQKPSLDKNRDSELDMKKTKLDEKQHSLYLKTFHFAIEFGFMIVVPLLGFIYLGKFLDNRYNSGNQLYIYVGIVLALITTCLLFMKKIRDIMKDMEQ